MKKYKGYLFLFVGCLGAFVLGAYTDGYVNHGVEIPTYKWFLNGGFMLMFLSRAISEFKSK